MLNFKPLRLEDVSLVRPYLQRASSRLCDSSVGGVFMWRDYFNTRYAIEDDRLFFNVTYPDGVEAFTVPFNADIALAAERLAEHCRETDIPPLICNVTSRGKKRLSSRFDIVREATDRDWYDYLYRSEDLMTLRGKKFNGQRNHINRFKKTYPNHEFVPISAANLPVARAFLEEIFSINPPEGSTGIEEARMVMEVFDNYDAYGLLGGMLMVDNRPIALSAGEIIRDTLFVHIEKANTAFSGAYQMMVNSFALHYGGGLRFINREEDVGDAGLRTSKLSYHPICLLEKHLVEIAPKS